MSCAIVASDAVDMLGSPTHWVSLDIHVSDSAWLLNCVWKLYTSGLSHFSGSMNNILPMFWPFQSTGMYCGHNTHWLSIFLDLV